MFLGMGLGAIHKLGITGEGLSGVTNALDFIAGYKSGEISSAPKRVVVIGAGNTAIDAANAAVRLGASEVTMVYRRGPADMSAFDFEYEHARQEGVRFLFYRQPVAVRDAGEEKQIDLQTFAASADGSLVPTADALSAISADLVILAIGQGTHTEFLATSTNIQMERGRILIDRASGQTSNSKYFAGGDCTNGGREVVDAVADGKRAGVGIAAWLEVTDAHA